MVGEATCVWHFCAGWVASPLGAFQQWHFCKMIMAPNKTGGGAPIMALLRTKCGPLEGGWFTALLCAHYDPL